MNTFPAFVYISRYGQNSTGINKGIYLCNLIRVANLVRDKLLSSYFLSFPYYLLETIRVNSDCLTVLLKCLAILLFTKTDTFICDKTSQI